MVPIFGGPQVKGFSLGFRVNSFSGLGLRDGEPRNGEPQQQSRNVVETYIPGSFYSYDILFLPCYWDSLFVVPIAILLLDQGNLKRPHPTSPQTVVNKGNSTKMTLN